MRMSDWSSDVCSSDLCPPSRRTRSSAGRGRCGTARKSSRRRLRNRRGPRWACWKRAASCGPPSQQLLRRHRVGVPGNGVYAHHGSLKRSATDCDTRERELHEFAAGRRVRLFGVVAQRLGRGRGVGLHRLQDLAGVGVDACACRSEEHTSELQSLMRISYAVFCWKKKNTTLNQTNKEKRI